jgi:hypothetical protein
MSKHKHADLILQYALDAQVSQTPWDRWESRGSDDDEWKTLDSCKGFNLYREYRRKILPVLSEEQVYSLYHYILDQPGYKPIDSCIFDWVEQQTPKLLSPN